MGLTYYQKQRGSIFLRHASFPEPLTPVSIPFPNQFFSTLLSHNFDSVSKISNYHQSLYDGGLCDLITLQNKVSFVFDDIKETDG
jgi:hypothetical protein